jgi:hypothetical protein
LVAEHLASEHGIEVARETLRGWMLSAGLWSRQRKRKPHRRRRERKAHFGELLQLDGSHHRWLEDRAEQGCLMNLVDDATGRGLFRFSAEETTWAAAELLEQWVRLHGVPKALYVDWKNVYKRKATTQEAVAGIKPETQFGRMCAKLGIVVIAASSPQAKGRVERHHSTHQDRLVKKMRLAGIGDYEAANRYLDEGYLKEHNERFACEPAADADFHGRVLKRIKLEQVFCLESERVVSNDFVVRFRKRLLQLAPKRNQTVGPRARVIVQQLKDSTLRVVHEGREVKFREIFPAAPPARPAAKTPRVAAAHKPAADHPWRKGLGLRRRAAS